MYNINVNLTIMPNFPDKETNEFNMDSPLDASKNGGYAPFSMKAKNASGLMKKNYGTPNKELKNPVAGASPMLDVTSRVHKLHYKDSDEYRRLHWPDDTHRTEREIFDYDETMKEERKEKEKKKKEKLGKKGKKGDDSPTGKRGALKHGKALTPVKHNLPGLRHTTPKKHGEYKQPHVHYVPGSYPREMDPTNEAKPTKVKRSVYRQGKKKNKNSAVNHGQGRKGHSN